MKSIFKASLLAGVLAGCTGTVGYRATVVAPPPPVATVTVEAPPPPAPPPEPAVATVEVAAPAPEVEVAYVEPTAFVSIGPDVQVIENYDYPVFFYGGMYWRNDGGVWYSSSYHDRGWITVNEVPPHIRTIERPNQYVHFHANVNARPGQIGYRAAVTAPIHHTAPPPRGIEQPGRTMHPVAPNHPAGHAVEPMHPAGHPVEPMHPAAGPAGHPVEPMHQAPPPAAHPVAPVHQAAPPPHPAAPSHPSTPTRKK